MWFRVDDRLPDHAKVRMLGRARLAAIGLWSLCGAWSGRNGTDGFIPRTVVRQYDAKLRTVPHLVRVGLWSETTRNGEPGWLFHDWPDWQPTAAAIEEVRRSRAEAGRRGGVRSGETRRSKTEASASKQTEANTNPEPEPEPEPLATDVASQGAPRKRGAARERATRIPDDFAVSADLAAWARAEAPDVDQRAETAKFVDYWRAKAGRDATKVDWQGTWRNWMRRAQENAANRRASRRFTPDARPTATDKIAALQAMKTGGSPSTSARFVDPGPTASHGALALDYGGGYR